MKKLVCITGWVLLFISLLSPSFSVKAQEYNGPSNVTTIGGIRFYESDDTKTTTSSNPSNLQEKEHYEKSNGRSGKSIFPSTGEKSSIAVLVIGLILVFIAFVSIFRKRSKR